jgi:hypothetical protein
MRGEMLFDTNGAYLLHVGNTHQHFLDAVLLQGAHAVLQRGRHHFRDACVLLDVLFKRVGAHQQLMQAHPPLVTTATADFTAHRIVDHQLAALAAVIGDPVLQQLGLGRLGILFPGLGVLQFLRVFDDQRLDLLGRRVVRFFALARTGVWRGAAPGCRAARRQS